MLFMCGGLWIAKLVTCCRSKPTLNLSPVSQEQGPRFLLSGLIFQPWEADSDLTLALSTQKFNQRPFRARLRLMWHQTEQNFSSWHPSEGSWACWVPLTGMKDGRGLLCAQEMPSCSLQPAKVHFCALWGLWEGHSLGGWDRMMLLGGSGPSCLPRAAGSPWAVSRFSFQFPVVEVQVLSCRTCCTEHSHTPEMCQSWVQGHPGGAGSDVTSLVSVQSVMHLKCGILLSDTARVSSCVCLERGKMLNAKIQLQAP